MTDVSRMLREIEMLPHFREFECRKCSAKIRVHVLQICAVCPNCGADYKCRGSGGIGTELQDLIDGVLLWAGRGESFDAVMRRREELITDSED
jgi:hypothetical protein